MRAVEVKPAEIPASAWNMKCLKTKQVMRPAWAYTWACVWMLRSIEAAEVRREHIKTCPTSRQVSLLIPKSKMDQEGKGVKRTLTCCGARSCPYQLAMLALADFPGAPDSQFPSCEGKKVDQMAMIRSWSKRIKNSMTGHSARRSGAMMHTRAGLPVQDIAFLGRWKSSVVFRYVEDAMEEVAFNGEGRRRPATSESCAAPSTPGAQCELPDQHASKRRRPERHVDTAATTAEKPNLSVQGKENDLWIVSKGRDKALVHSIGKAAWNVPLDEWSTVCGWAFARRNVKVQITKWKPRGTPECKKCLEIKYLRDGVRAAKEWAHAMCWPSSLSKTGKLVAP